MVRKKKTSGSSNLIPVKPHILEKVFLELGYVFDCPKGSHKIFYRDDDILPIVIPFHSGREIPPSIIKDQINRAGISKEEFLEILRLFTN